MISSMGFIPNNSEITKLTKFIPDEDVKNSLEYMKIPFIEEEGEIQIDEIIKPTDEILFCTPNTEEISNLAFYGYDEKEIYFHHDLFVFSTILDSVYLGNNKVALATFEPDIFVYDAFTNFPILPQILLKGHEETVTGIKNKNTLLSCSQDKTVIEWDLETMKYKNIMHFEFGISKFDFEGKSLVLGTENYLNFTNSEVKGGSENFSLDFELEQVKIYGHLVYVSDSNGGMNIFDLRNTRNRLIYKADAHSDAILDFVVMDGHIVTTSLDKSIKIWDLGLNYIREEKVDSPVYCFGVNLTAKSEGSMNEIFCGNEDDVVFPMRI